MHNKTHTQSFQKLQQTNVYMSKINTPNTLMLSMLGKNFSRRHFEIFFSFFLEEKDLTLHANCLLRRQSARNIKSCFLGKMRKMS